MDKAFSKMSVSCSDHTWILREMTGNNHQPQQFEVESTFTSVFINFGWGENNISLGECLASISLDIFTSFKELSNKSLLPIKKLLLALADW